MILFFIDFICFYIAAPIFLAFTYSMSTHEPKVQRRKINAQDDK